MTHRFLWIGLSLLLTACGGGGGGGSDPPPPPPDTTAPDTTLLAPLPDGLTNNPTATFTFVANEAATFEARLDGGTYAAVTSPRTIVSLPDGSHSFEIRARDAAGNVDGTPAIHTWIVDTTPPDTEFSTTPPAVSSAEPHSFGVFAPGLAAPSTIEMSVDGAPYIVAHNPVQLSLLANGSHTVLFRIRDAAGNVDPTPASHTWTVDLGALNTTLATGTAAIANTNAISFNLGSTITAATFEYRLDGGSWTTTGSPLQLAGLADGDHLFEARARTSARVDDTPASFAWTIDRTPPTGAVVFPTRVSYTDAATLTFRGTAGDATGVESVAIGGVAATSTDGFATWSAVVPVIAAAINNYHVTYRDRAGNSTAHPHVISVTNNGALLTYPFDLDYDPVADRVVAVDFETQSVLTYRVSDGYGAVVSGPERSATPGNSTLQGIIVDSARNRALVVDSAADALVAVDLTTGERTTISSGNGTGPLSIQSGRGMALDVANNRVFIAVQFQQGVTAVDLATGARTVITGPTVGTGPLMINPRGLALDITTGTHLYVGNCVDANTSAIYEINIATGNRVTFSPSLDPGDLTQPRFVSPEFLRIDAARVWLYLLDTAGTGSIQRVLLNGVNRGNRELFAYNGQGGGGGEPFAYPRGLGLKNSTGRLITAQHTGELISVNAFTGARSLTSHARVGTGPSVAYSTVIIEQPTGMPTSLLATDPHNGALLRVDLASGDRSVISGGGVGQGLALGTPRDLTLDTRPSAGASALVLDAALGAGAGSLVSVNLSTGDRTTLASLGAVVEPGGIVLDDGANRVLFTDDDINDVTTDDAVYAVNLATGMRTTISGTTRGIGAAFTGPGRLLLQPRTNPVYAIVADTRPSQLVQVNLATGDRSPLIANTGNPALGFVYALYLDEARARLLGVNASPIHLFEIPLPMQGNARSLISGQSSMFGPVRGSGPLTMLPSSIDARPSLGLAFVHATNAQAIFAVDLVSGDRVLVAH